MAADPWSTPGTPEDAQQAGADLEAVEQPERPAEGHCTCALCGEPLAGRRRHAKHCSGACRAAASRRREAARRREAESAPSPNVRFPVESEWVDDAERQTTQEGVAAVYGRDAATAAELLAAQTSELFLRGMTQFHLRRLGWPDGPDDADDVIAVLRAGLRGA